MEGAIPEGSEITVLDERQDAIYFNGGMVAPSYQRLLLNFIKNDKLRNEYLREEYIPYNKL